MTYFTFFYFTLLFFYFTLLFFTFFLNRECLEHFSSSCQLSPVYCWEMILSLRTFGRFHFTCGSFTAVSGKEEYLLLVSTYSYLEWKRYTYSRKLLGHACCSIWTHSRQASGKQSGESGAIFNRDGIHTPLTLLYVLCTPTPICIHQKFDSSAVRISWNRTATNNKQQTNNKHLLHEVFTVPLLGNKKTNIYACAVSVCCGEKQTNNFDDDDWQMNQ